MSSLRNSIQRPNHRERAQPFERRRLGPLEKHKDYALRAQDYNRKKQQLASLRHKAANRNEDEFYFGMMSRQGPGQRINGGKHWNGAAVGNRGNRSLSVDAARLLKTQDIGYVRTMKQVMSKEVEDLRQHVVVKESICDQLEQCEESDNFFGNEGTKEKLEARKLSPQPKVVRKLIFLTDEEDQRAHVQSFQTESARLKCLKVYLNEADRLKAREMMDNESKSLKRMRRHLKNSQQKLAALTDAEIALDIQQASMAKTATSAGFTRKGKKLSFKRRKR